MRPKRGRPQVNGVRFPPCTTVALALARIRNEILIFLKIKDDIAAMDLFTVPTASLRLLYGFFVIEHGRRHIVHFNATFHPTSAWVI